MAEAIPAQNAPYPHKVEAGRDYFRCARGRTARGKTPLCAGTHSRL